MQNLGSLVDERVRWLWTEKKPLAILKRGEESARGPSEPSLARLFNANPHCSEKAKRRIPVLCNTSKHGIPALYSGHCLYYSNSVVDTIRYFWFNFLVAFLIYEHERKMILGFCSFFQSLNEEAIVSCCLENINAARFHGRSGSIAKVTGFSF